MGLLLAGLLLLSGCAAATSTEPEPQPQEQQISQQVVEEQSTAEQLQRNRKSKRRHSFPSNLRNQMARYRRKNR